MQIVLLNHKSLNYNPKTMHLLDSATEMPYKIYLFIGFITGTISSFLAGHLNDLVLTFALGVASALGAAFGKYLLVGIKHYLVRGKKKEDRDESGS